MSFLNMFAHHNEMLEVAAGQRVFSEGEVGDKMYVLLEGRVGIHVHDQLVSEVEPGELIGEMALIDSSPRSATATALEDSKLAVVDEKRFLFLVQQTPFFALQVMRLLVSRLRSMDQKV